VTFDALLPGTGSGDILHIAPVSFSIKIGVPRNGQNKIYF
jgi:hypothetical protein